MNEATAASCPFKNTEEDEEELQELTARPAAAKEMSGTLWHFDLKIKTKKDAEGSVEKLFFTLPLTGFSESLSILEHIVASHGRCTSLLSLYASLELLLPDSTGSNKSV